MNVFINLLSECTFGNKYLNKNKSAIVIEFLAIDKYNKNDDDYYFFHYIEDNLITDVCNEIYAKRVIQKFTYDYLCAS